MNALPTSEQAGQRVRLGKLNETGVAVLIDEADASRPSGLSPPQQAGFYLVETTGPAGTSAQTVAANVDPNEGDLRVARDDALRELFAELGVTVESAVALSADLGEGGPSPLPPALGLLVIALLFGEQALAIAASYHDSARGGRA